MRNNTKFVNGKDQMKRKLMLDKQNTHKKKNTHIYTHTYRLKCTNPN